MSESEPAEPTPTPDASDDAEPAGPRRVTAEELANGLELEIEQVHELEIDPGFTFSA